MPARQTASGVAPVMGVPSNRTSPASGARRPDTTLRSVVLPEPLGPIRPTTSPLATVKETPSSAARPPKWRVRSDDLEQGAVRRSWAASSRLWS